jgi:hypothetical protein
MDFEISDLGILFAACPGEDHWRSGHSENRHSGTRYRWFTNGIAMALKDVRESPF